MFTGIIQSVGSLISREEVDGDLRLQVNPGDLDLSDVLVGDSIAIDGICLTVIKLSGQGMYFDASLETMDKTTIQYWQKGQLLNLEKAVKVGQPLGGHLVSGHVDTVIRCVGKNSSARSVIYQFELPAMLSRYLVFKGSIVLNGVSLTVNQVDEEKFTVNLIEHTLKYTNLKDIKAGDLVNMEVDMIARYVEKMMS